MRIALSGGGQFARMLALAGTPLGLCPRNTAYPRNTALRCYAVPGALRRRPSRK